MNPLKAITLVLGIWMLSSCQTALVSPENSGSEPSALSAAKMITTDSAEEQVYATLKQHKAEAIALALGQTPLEKQSEPPQAFRYPTSDHPNPSAAALTALAVCEEARVDRSTPTHPCELRRRGDQLIHSTWELKRGLADNRPGFIWQVQNQDTVVYLAGSVHLLKPTLEPPPSFMAAFEQATALVLEVDQRNQTPEQMQALAQSYMLLPQGTAISSLLTETEINQVKNYLTGIGAEAGAATVLKPAAVLLMASALEYTSIGYLPEYGLEGVFTAKLGNRPLLALESMEQQLAAATALPLELQAELLIETIEEAESTPEQISNLVHAWWSGDEEDLANQFEEATNSAAANQWLDDLLIKRNRGMAEGIANLLSGTDPRITDTGPQTIFVVVGAAHLVGEDSVIELLEQRGYKLERLKHNSLSLAE